MPDLVKLCSAPSFTFGADPEFFFAKEGEIIGAERVINNAGLWANYSKSGYGGAMVLDGVQVEIHPMPASCRASVGGSIAESFRALKDHLVNQKYSGITASFKQVIEVPKRELDALSERSRTLGCGRSENIYGNTSIELANINAAEYRTRSAGGHIHIGFPLDYAKGRLPNRSYESLGYRYPLNRFVPLLDVVVGNTCVLLDRDPGQKERRKLYGRAGEYRTPPYGVEYRTLSNFWLRGHPLFSFVLALCRFSGAIMMANGKYQPDYEAALMTSVDLEMVPRAINENDFDLAMRTWVKVKEFIQAHVQERDTAEWAYDISSNLTICPNDLEATDYVIAKGIDHFFKEDPVEHWAGLKDCHGHGWEAFLDKVVKEEMKNG